MSSLEVLSMSGNKLEDKIFLADGHSFGFLPNLTVLELDRNKFTQLPIEELIQHKKLQRLNLGYNQLTKYNPELTEMVKKGLQVEYEGNDWHFFSFCLQITKNNWGFFRGYFVFLNGTFGLWN